MAEIVLAGFLRIVTSPKGSSIRLVRPDMDSGTIPGLYSTTPSSCDEQGDAEPEGEGGRAGTPGEVLEARWVHLDVLYPDQPRSVYIKLGAGTSATDAIARSHLLDLVGSADLEPVHTIP